MSTNETLEIKIDEITNSIKGLSEKSSMSSADMNYLVDKLATKVEEANEDNFMKLASDVSETITDVLNNKYSDVSEKLSLVEEFLEDVQKNSDTSKFEVEITRILNDIEALHSKMNSQELQTENLIKAFEAMKNTSASGQISKLCDEIVSISKSYDDISEILNKNFQEFLRKVETTSSRDEFQRLRYNLENLDGNQNILVSAMNAVNEKQDEIKNLIKQASNSTGAEKLEQLQNALNQLNRLILDTTTKSDLEVMGDKISSVSDLIGELKRSYDEMKDDDGIRGVINGQLNNIIAQLEDLKMNSNSNVGEDIIRLYTSIAEFKDNVYSSVNAQLNEVVTSMDVQLDKISNSISNSINDSNISVNNLTDEMQKLNGVISEGLNAKTYEIKQEFEKQGKQNSSTIISSIKNELSALTTELNSLNNSEGISELAKSIEALRNGFDFESLILQVQNINSALDFTPIKRELEALNKDETISSINEKADIILDYIKSGDVVNKIEELQKSLDFEGIYKEFDSINEKINLKPIEDKILSVKEAFAEIDFTSNLSAIKENLSQVEAISEKLSSIREIEGNISEIKNIIEENVRVNIQKIDEDKEFSQSVKDALKVIHENVVNMSNDNTELDILNEVKENLELYSSKITDIISDINSNYEKLTSSLNEGLEKFNPDVEAKIEAARVNLENSLSSVNDKISEINSKINSKDDKTTDEIKDELLKLSDFVQNLHTTSVAEHFDENLKASILSLEGNIKTALNLILESAVASKNQMLSDLIKNQSADLSSEIADYIKNETEILNSILDTKTTKNKEEIITKIEEIIENKINSESKINFIKDITDKVSEIYENIGAVKMGFEANSDFVNELNEKIEALEEEIKTSINNIGIKITQENLKENINQNGLEIKKLIGRVNENLVSVNNTINEKVLTSEKFDNITNPIKNDIASAKQSISDIKTELQNSKTAIIEQIKEQAEDIKSSLENEFARNESDGNSILTFGTMLEQKINGKISILESLIDESIDRIDKKTETFLTTGNEAYKALLDEKFEQAVQELKNDYEAKLTDIQKIIDDKVFEIISNNNEIIKDELKYKSDAISRNIEKALKDKLVPVASEDNEAEDEEEQYTIKDIESDLAKIRLGLEKNNKLTNFKEFAARLIELKNINLENSKISRVIGADIMKFDSWLKNTTAKIELLAAKIEKSEKIKMEDLKTRLMQSDKNQAMPQKLEEAVMSIYKKYRSQETKIDELMTKIDILSQKQADSFDVKEFIDVFYDNTKKQENLVSRMDSIEDKMDLIQGKIDHIIASCIDE